MPIEGIRAGIRADGRVFVGDEVSTIVVPVDGPVELSVVFNEATRQLGATARVGDEQATVLRVVDAKAVSGGVDLVAHAPRPRPWRGDKPALTWRFSEVKATGSGLKVHRDRTFGPILWTQYTLSDSVLKLSAQMPPIGVDDAQTVTLEVNRGDGWRRVAEAPIDSDARTALLRVDDWDDTADTPYRVAYEWGGETHHWSGTIRRDPGGTSGGEPFALAAFSCDVGHAFPAPLLVAEAARQDPDLMFFAGDQIYESYGGFGIIREPVDLATLDYLRKWYQFGWTWRELLRDRPSVVIPDDHDVYQGNLWGAGGRKLPGNDFALGGYRMAVPWVNMVERTQTSHLPDAIDPVPLASGIGVYFTQLNYGGGSFAVIEDRKFKTGFKSAIAKHGITKPREVAVERLDLPDAVLLGDRQLAFLERWGQAHADRAFNVVLSQTMFAHVFTHGGPKLQRNTLDLDTNAWPPTPRNRALKLIADARAVMVCGDQHFGALVRHGIERQGDGPLQFMTTGTVNGWPRAAWPGIEENNPQRVDIDPLGPRLDPFGHPIDVLAVGNPQPRSNVTPYASPQKRAREKGSGFGVVRFDPARDRIVFDLLRYPAPKADEADRFPGFPVEMSLSAATSPTVD